jgi:general secretion pathway protein D
VAIGESAMNEKIITALLGLAAVLGGQVPPPATAQQAPAAPRPIPMGNLNLENASLTAVIDQLAQRLKLNLIVDPTVKGSITLNTYGDTSTIDPRNLLEMILRINGYGLVQEGELYRVIPLKNISHMPLHPEINQKNIADDDQTILNLVFLKYVSVEELTKVLSEFSGENSQMIPYPPANLLFLLDSRRNMRRTMELIAQFDSDVFANQRVRLYEVKNVKPSDAAKDLDNIFKSISLDAKSSPVRFIGVDRINTLIAVAPNPGVFDNVADWLKKLDVPVKITAGTIDNNVYKVIYGRAECLAQALNELFNPGYGRGGFGAGGYGNNVGGTANTGVGVGGAYGGGYGGGYAGGYGGGTNAGGYGNQNSFNNGFGGSAGCMATGMGGGGGAGLATQAYGNPTFGGYAAQVPAGNATGLPIGSAAAAGTNTAVVPGALGVPAVVPPRIIANPLDNKLIIQADAQQYQNILKILKELDVPPRQILLEAKFYSVDLTTLYSTTVQADLNKNGVLGNALSPFHQLLGSLTSAGSAVVTGGTLVGQSRQLLLSLSASESRTYSKLLSEPSLIATDSIPASIFVGTQVPVSTGTTNIPSAGGVVTSSGVSSENTGITLQVNARVNSSGVVTLMINQENSSVNGTASNSNGTAFNQQTVQTQITMMDGDTIAIGGMIAENITNTTTGIPGLVNIPYIGWLFGTKTFQKDRSELIMFFTPHVIFDETQLIEASDELKTQVKLLKRDIRRL